MCAAVREIGCAAGAIGLSKGSHLEGVGIDLLRAENAETDQAFPVSKVLSRLKGFPRKSTRVESSAGVASASSGVHPSK
jgi:hypothetical protein